MKLMVIDGNSILNRAFYGVRPLSTRDGLPTQAVYGFLTILLKLLDEISPDALCVTFDLKEPTFRHEAFEGYKAKRKAMPEDLAVQVPILKEVLDAMNIPRYELAGWEADDLIGTIARRCEEKGWDCAVITGDRDSLQLITEKTHVDLVSTRMGQTTTREMTPETFAADYGFEPCKMVDLKALMGDPSDNIPGVPGIGEKTAMDLVQKYGTIDELYAAFEELALKPATRRKLDEGREMAQISHGLAAIRRDAPIEFQPEDDLRRPPDAKALYEIFLRLEFSKLIERLGLSAASAGSAAHRNEEKRRTTETVADAAELDALLARWEQAEYVSFLALPSLDGAAVCCGSHISILFQNRLGDEGYRRFLREFFSARIRKVSHESKDLMNRLLGEGLSTDGFVFDTAVAAYLLAPTDGSYALERLGISYFNRELPPSAAFTAPDAFAPLADSTAALAVFSAHAALVDDLYESLAAELTKLGMEELYNKVELPLCPVLAEMERTGFLVDRGALSAFGATLAKGIDAAQAAIYELAGEQFNINSTQQLGGILFDKLGLPPVKKTKTGYSTNVEVLEKLRGRHPIIDSIMEYRQLTKLQSTYVEGLTKVIAPDGRIHTSFQNTATATGRLSSTEPNLQNIPIRTKLGAELRKMFVAAPGCVLVDADYSQIELRLLAHISGDEAMIHAFRTGEDIHTITASQVFGVPPEHVTRGMRSSAKAVNFGIVYGISDFSLSQDIGVSRKEARAYMDRYFEKYSGVRAYMDKIVEKAREDGYVSTLMGRRRWLPELKSANFNLRSFGERVALNMPIQGTAADIIKLAMLRVSKRLREERLAAKLVLQVHDELIVECPEEEAERVKRLLPEEMEKVMSLSVLLKAEAGVGKSWAEAH